MHIFLLKSWKVFGHRNNMIKGFLHTRFFRHIHEHSHSYIFRYRWTKNGFMGPKRFWGFQEIGTMDHFFFQSLQEYGYEHVTDGRIERQKIHSLDPFISTCHRDLFLMISVYCQAENTKWNHQLKLKDNNN